MKIDLIIFAWFCARYAISSWKKKITNTIFTGQDLSGQIFKYNFWPLGNPRWPCFSWFFFKYEICGRNFFEVLDSKSFNLKFFCFFKFLKFVSQVVIKFKSWMRTISLLRSADSQQPEFACQEISFRMLQLQKNFNAFPVLGRICSNVLQHLEAQPFKVFWPI